LLPDASTAFNQPDESHKRQKRLRQARFFRKAPVAIAGVLGWAYAFFVAVRFKEDTTPITNAASAVMVALASLSFTFARVIKTDALRDRVTFAGERFLHGAILVLVASILRYFVFHLYEVPFVGFLLVGLPIVKLVVSASFGVFGGALLLQGVVFAHGGLRILNDLLWSRMDQHKDWYHLW